MSPWAHRARGGPREPMGRDKAPCRRCLTLNPTRFCERMSTARGGRLAYTTTSLHNTQSPWQGPPFELKGGAGLWEEEEGKGTRDPKFRGKNASFYKCMANF